MTIARVANSGPFASTFLFLLLGPLALAGAAPSLVAHYALDEGKGNIAHDNTASQYHSVTGGLEWATEGGRTALEFDGKGRCLDCGPGARLGLSDTVTLSLWFFPRAIPPEKNEVVLFGQYPGTLGLTYYQGRVYFYLRGPDKQYRVAVAAPPGRWYHAAAVADGKTIKLYINQALRGAESLPGGTMLPVADHIRIGGRPGVNVSFNGLITDARIYRTALSAKQIQGILASSLKAMEQMPPGPWTAVELPESREGLAEFEEVAISDWQPHAGKVISVWGIPFRLGDSVVSGARTHLKAKESTRIQVSPSAQTVYALLAVHLPRKAPGRRGKPYAMSQASCPHRLSCELLLADGSREWMIPLHLRLKGHHWTHGVGAYALHSSQGTGIKEVILHDKMDSAAVGVLAVTASSEKLRERPKPSFPHYVLRPWQGTVSALPKPEQTAEASMIQSSDGVMAVALDFSNGRPVWKSLGILPIALDNILRNPGPLWDVEIEGQGSAPWQHEAAQLTDKGFDIVSSLKPSEKRHLRATLKAEWAEPGALIVDVSIANMGQTDERIGKLHAPMLSNVMFDSPEDTWYWCSAVGGVINNLPIDLRQAYGVWHPLQADGFFSPSRGWGLGLMTRDTEGVFRYFVFKKGVEGGAYAQEYLPCTLKPGETKQTVPLAIRAMPGDWKAQFNWYKAWLSTWWKRASPPKPWFRRAFSFVNYAPWQWRAVEGVSSDRREDLPFWVKRYTKMIGAVDIFYMYGWAVEDIYKDSHDGVYYYDGMGGQQRFRRRIAQVQQMGTLMGLYLNGYLAHTKAEKMYPPLRDMRKWQIHDADGKPAEDDWGNPARLTAYMCPSQKGWRDYLIHLVYLRIRRDLGVNVLYVDQYGKGGMRCYRHDHGHAVGASCMPFEQLMLKELREALPDDVATFTEYTPADVMMQYVDGAYGHVARYGSEDVGRPLLPHMVDLPRFAFPAFKSIDLISRALKNGNVDYQKVFLFNGDTAYTAGYLLEQSDAEGRAWLKNVIRVLKKYDDAFASDTVEPLVETLIPGVYANRFEGKNRTVWTFYNATAHSVDSRVLSLPAKPNVSYYDPYYDRPVNPVVQGDRHLVGALVWPNDVGCLVREDGE